MVAVPNHPLRWRVLQHAPASGAWNMAADEALARELQPGTAVLRLYEWSSATVSLGRNQPGAGRYDLSRASALGLSFVRRPTGGRAVIHDRELTYAVMLPDQALGGPRAIYVHVQAALARGLINAGANEVLQEPDNDRPAPRPSLHPCFGHALPGEVTVEGSKVVGSAQARIDGVVLQHGAILLQNDQSLLQALTLGSGDAPTERPVPLANAGVAGSPRDVARHVLKAFEETIPGRYEQDTLSERENHRLEELQVRYQSDAWTWRT